MNIKNTVIEGWLKKKKSSSSKNFFSKFTKRWFTLDVPNAMFTYSSGKGKKSKMAVPLREIIEVVRHDETTNPETKEWEFEFRVLTVDRVYHLFAQNQHDKDMWVGAFEAILEMKKKEAEGKDKKEKKKKKSKDKKKKNKKDKTDSDELDIDAILRKGPQETVKLEPPSPAKDFGNSHSNFAPYGQSICDSDSARQPSHSLVDRQVTSLSKYSNYVQRTSTDLVSSSKENKNANKEPTRNHYSDEHTKNSSGTELKHSLGEHEGGSSSSSSGNSADKEPSFEDDWDESEDYESLNDFDGENSAKHGQQFSTMHGKLPKNTGGHSKLNQFAKAL